MKIVNLSYASFIAMATAKSLPIQYRQDAETNSYDIFCMEAGGILWQTAVVLDGGPNQTDFEANHKDTANAVNPTSIIGTVAAVQSGTWTIDSAQAETPISTILNPSLSVGTVCYYQNGAYGSPKGLLLSLTNTPSYLRCIMTDHGLRRING